MGEARKDALRVDFDRSVKLQFHGSTIGSDGGLLVYRELDEVFALTALTDESLSDLRTGVVPVQRLSGKSRVVQENGGVRCGGDSLWFCSA